MTGSTTRAPHGSDLNPKDAIPCAACGIKLGANAVHNIVGGPILRVLCTSCIHRIPLHRRLYPACPVEYHDCMDHPFISVTRDQARQIIKERTP